MINFIGLKGFYDIYDYSYYFKDEISVGDRIKIEVINKDNGEVVDIYRTIIFEIEKENIEKLKNEEKENYLENISDEIHNQLIFGWKNKYFKEEFKSDQKLNSDEYLFFVELDNISDEIVNNNIDSGLVDWL